MASAAPAMRIPKMRGRQRLRSNASIFRPSFAPLAVQPLSPPPDFTAMEAAESITHPILEARRLDRRAVLGSVVFHIAIIALTATALHEPAKQAASPPPITGMSVTLIDEPPAATARTRAPRTQVGANSHAPAGAAAPAALAPFEISSKALAPGVPIISPEAAAPSAVPDPAASDLAEGAAPNKGDKNITPKGQPDPRSLEEERWEGAILTLLQQKKRYPRIALRRGEGDTVMLRITLDRQGRLLLAEVSRSRGIPALDREALALAKRAAPFPIPPPSVLGDAVRVVVPIEFVIRPSARPLG